MSAQKGKYVALMAASLSFAVLAAAGVASRDAIREHWYLHKLESDILDERKEAAAKLGEMGSLSAVPKLFGLWREERIEVLKARGLVASQPELFDLSFEGMNVKRSIGGTILAAKIDLDYTLSACVRMGEKVVPALCESLSSSDSMFRLAAVLTLGKIGGVAVVAVPELLTLLSERDAELRESVLLALKDIGARAIPSLLTALLQGEPSVRRAAAESLPVIEGGHPEVELALTRALNDPDQAVRAEAFSAMLRVTSQPGDPERFLLKALEHERSDVRKAAAKSLRPSSSQAREALVTALADEVEDVRDAACSALVSVAFRSERDALKALESADYRLSEVRPASLLGLIAGLRASSVNVRLFALAALGRLGPAAMDAVPGILELSNEWSRQGMTTGELITAVLDRIRSGLPASLPGR